MIKSNLAESIGPLEQGESLPPTTIDILLRLHRLQESVTRLRASQLRLLKNMDNGQAKTIKKEGKRKRTIRPMRLLDDLQMDQIKEFPEFYEDARQLADMQYQAIREHRTPDRIRHLQTNVFEHWAHATEDDLQTMGETECDRDKFYSLNVYMERARTIHRTCAAIVEKLNAEQDAYVVPNAYVVPSIGSETGFFDHGVESACSATRFYEKGVNLTKRLRTREETDPTEIDV